MTPEDRLIMAYVVANETLAALARECERVFLSQAREALARGDVAEARAVLKRCPDDVTKCFIMDSIRQAGAKP